MSEHRMAALARLAGDLISSPNFGHLVVYNIDFADGFTTPTSITVKLNPDIEAFYDKESNEYYCVSGGREIFRTSVMKEVGGKIYHIFRLKEPGLKLEKELEPYYRSYGCKTEIGETDIFPSEYPTEAILTVVAGKFSIEFIPFFENRQYYRRYGNYRVKVRKEDRLIKTFINSMTVRQCGDFLASTLGILVKGDRALQRSCLEQELLSENFSGSFSSSILQIVNQTTGLL